jgi:hypothetical protein
VRLPPELRQTVKTLVTHDQRVTKIGQLIPTEILRLVLGRPRFGQPPRDAIGPKLVSITQTRESVRLRPGIKQLDRLFVFSLHHNDEEDSAFVPAAEPAQRLS